MKQDVIDSIGAVRREVRSGERDGQPTRAVVAERTYDTTIDDVWDAITNGERIPRWFLPVEGDLRRGGRYQLQGNAGGEITTCDAPTHLAVTWEYGGATSWVDVHLAEDPEGGTRLRLEHVALVDDNDIWDQFGPGAVGIGWDLTLFGLAEHIRTGEAVAGDHDDPASGPGAEFMAASSDGWCEADIASGTPEGTARAAAARTLAAYTGEGDPEEGGGAPADGAGEDGAQAAAAAADAEAEGGGPPGG
jgi:uncharacterized protein YndB with AHSA1/START domain